VFASPGIPARFPGEEEIQLFLIGHQVHFLCALLALQRGAEAFRCAPLLYRSDPVVVLVAFLFVRAPGGVTVDHVAESAGEDHEDEDQEDEWWHRVIPFLILVSLLEALLAFNG
jgi:hypothetical protein